MKCANCNTDKYLAVLANGLVINHGPEGHCHEIECIKCGKLMKTSKLPAVFKDYGKNPDAHESVI